MPYLKLNQTVTALFLITVLIFTVPLSIPAFLSVDYFQHSRLALAWLLACLASPALWSMHQHSLRNTGLIWAIVFSITLIPASLLLPNATVTWLEPYQFSAFIIISTCFGVWLTSTQRLSQALIQFVVLLHIFAFIYAVISVYTYIFAMLDQVQRLDQFLPWGFINIRYWSQVASWALPILPLSLLITPLKQYTSWRLSLYFTLTIWFWILILSVARGSGIGLISAVLITALLFRRSCLPWLKIFLTGAVAGFLCWLLLSIWLPSLLIDSSELRNATLTSSGRIPLWKEAWAMSWKNFPLGMGPFSWISHTAITEGFEQGKRYGHPHNMYLFFAAEYGWLSVLALLGLCLHAAKQLIPLTKNSEPNLSLIAFTASVIAALTHSFFSAVLLTPNSLLIGFAVLALYWGLLHENTPLTQTNRSPISVLAIKALAVIMFVLGIFWLKHVYDFKEQVQKDLDNPDVRVIGINSPRFWDNSHIPQKTNEKDIE